MHVTRIQLTHGDETLGMLVRSWQEVDELLPTLLDKETGPLSLFGEQDGEVMFVDHVDRGWFRRSFWSCGVHTAEWSELLTDPSRQELGVNVELVREAVRAYCETGERKASLRWVRMPPAFSDRLDLLEGGRPE